jgi:carboxypeptidase Q
MIHHARSILLAAAAFLLAPPIAHAARTDEAGVAEYQATVEQILASSLSEGQAYDLLSELCRVAPRRLSGSPGASAATTWAKETLRELGFENIRLEDVTVPHWVRGDVGEVRFAEPPELSGDHVPMLALGGSIGTPDEGLTAEVILADGLDAVAELGEQARGKIVLLNRPMDPSLVSTFDAYGGAVSQRSRGAIEAAKVGAVAALVRSMTPGHDDIPHTGAMHYAEGIPKIPFAAVSTNGADHIASLIESGKRVVLNLRQNCRTLPDTEGHNVIGELVGRESPEEILVVGGHLDAWDVGEGAHDDGGGCCQAIEAVRLIKSLGLRPRRTLRVVLFANEENGLGGGNAYLAAHRNEMGRHVLALESDSGCFTPRGFTTDANPEAFAILSSVSALLANAGAGLLEPGGGGADIGPMKAEGVVQLGYLPDSQRYFDLHHTHEDTLDKVSPREINLGAGVMAAMLYVIADLPTTLPRNDVK